MLFVTFALLNPLQNGIYADRADMAQRLLKLDRAWMRQRNEESRRLAVPLINNAVQSFFSGRASATCMALDSAIAKLENRVPLPEDSVGARLTPMLIDAASYPELKIYRCYETTRAPLQVTAGKISGSLSPGEMISGRWKLDPIKNDRFEKLRISVGSERFELPLTRVQNLDSRLRKFNDEQPWLAYLRDASDSRRQPELAYDLLPMLRLVEKPTLEVWEQSYIRSGRIPIRVQIPKKLNPAAATVVIALHGAGGDEHMFMESYGRGEAAKLAARRGWIFMSPKAESRSISACLRWLEDQKITTKNLFLVGHSMGGGIIASAGQISPKPLGMALFAPATMSIERLGAPAYVAIGAQDNLFGGRINTFIQQAKGNPQVELKVADPCEHLMIVADEIGNAYKFFDKQLKLTMSR